MPNCAPATIQFMDESGGTVDTWNWTFSDGAPNTSTIQNPAITFNNPGTHEITLMVTNAAGSNTFTMEITLDGTPSASFSSDVDILTTTFTNTTTNATSYFWDFGDGNSSTMENPIHEYDVAGNYTVILSATNDCGTVTFTQQVEVVGPQAVANFSSSEIDGCVPFTVNFEDLSLGNPTSWAWEFPGGNPATSTEENPTVTYTTAGVYDVILTVSNPAGQATVEQTDYINIGEAPTADFTPSIDVNGTVTFNNNSTLGDTYEWLFGDGNSSNEETPAHTYDSSALYTVQLVVTNPCGNDTTSQEILIQLTSTSELSFLEKFELYPNPNNGQFVLHLEGQPLENLNIRLYNILGQQIMEEPVDFSSGSLIKTFDLQELSAATYILQIESENKVMYRKVVKE
ncbi:MAG: PKD domain-containing protein [Bacteroidota bacterium]